MGEREGSQGKEPVRVSHSQRSVREGECEAAQSPHSQLYYWWKVRRKYNDNAVAVESI